MELNKIYKCDCMEGLKRLPDNSIDLIIVSPPYNLKGFKGGAESDGGLWKSTIRYDSYDDNMTEEEYQAWQVKFLNLCAKKLKDDGSIFYNHKNRTIDGTTVSPLQWILRSSLNLRQEIVWNRGGSVRLHKSYYLSNTERVYWLTKSKTNVRFSRQSNISEVWDISPDCCNEHPAPFPVALPDSIIPHVLGDKKMRAEKGNLVVLDPFMGSGTVAVSAKKWGCDYIGFDISEKYIKMAEKRIAQINNENNVMDNFFDYE